MSLEDDADADVTFSVSGPLQFRSWFTNDSSDSDAEMLNLLDNEERPSRQDPAPSTSQTSDVTSQRGAVTSQRGAVTSQQDAVTLDMDGATSPATNGRSEGLSLSSSWGQNHKASIERQLSAGTLETEREDTAKCIFSSFLFFVIIGALFVFIFLKNPAG